MKRKIILDAEVFTRVIKEINPTAAAIYATIMGHRNGKTGVCYVTQATLAEECNTTERTIIRNLNELKIAGFLDWKKGSNFSSKANSYIFPLESFDLEGKGAKIEEKKLKDKNKEEKIKERVKKKFEEDEVVEVPAEVKEVRIEKKKAKAEERKVSNDINLLIRELNKLIAEYNELAKDNMDLFKNGFIPLQFNIESNIKKLIKEEKIEVAISILNNEKEKITCMLESLKKDVNFEKLSNKITLEEAIRVFNLVKGELSESMIKSMEERIIPRGNARSIVSNCKVVLENKGISFDLQALLSA